MKYRSGDSFIVSGSAIKIKEGFRIGSQTLQILDL